MPAAEIAWVVRARQASTTSGAARSATSRIAPGPLLSAIASRSTVLASRATTRTVGLRLPCQQRDLEIEVVVIVGADHRGRVRHPGGHQTLRSRDYHDLGTGILQLLDDPQSQRVISTDDCVALHSEHATAEKPVAKGKDVPMSSGPKTYLKACINGARTPTSTRICR